MCSDDHDIDDTAWMPASRQCRAAACIMYQVPLRLVVDDGVPALHRNVDRCLRELTARAVIRISTRLQFSRSRQIGLDGIRLPDICCVWRNFLARAATLRAVRASSLVWLRPTKTTCAPRPCEQPGDRAPNSACRAGHHYDHILQRIRCEHRALNGEFVVREAEHFRWRPRIASACSADIATAVFQQFASDDHLADLRGARSDFEQLD